MGDHVGRDGRRRGGQSSILLFLLLALGTGWLTDHSYVWNLRLVGCLVGTYRSLRSREDRVEGIEQGLHYRLDLLFSPLNHTSRPGPYRRHPLSPPARILTATSHQRLLSTPFLLRSRSTFTPTPHPLHPHPHHPGSLLTFRAKRWSRLRYASFCISSIYTLFVFPY